MRRLSVVMLVVALTLSAETANASWDVTVTFQHASPTTPEPEARTLTPRAGTVLTGLWKVVVSAQSRSSLRSFTVSILPTDSGIASPSQGSISRSYSVGTKSSDTITRDWDTNVLTPFNGNYRIVGVSESHVGDREEITVSNLRVNNPPVPPTGLTVKLVNDVPSLTWNKSTEPDLTGYSIHRSDDGADFKQVGSSTKAAFDDSNAPKGTQLRYRIVAMRKSPVNASGVSSVPSESSAGIVISTGVMITVPATGPASAPAPLTAPVREGTHQGFAESLPIEGLEGLPPAAAGVAEAEGPPPDNAIESILTAPARLLESTVKKLPFVAVALLLLVSAMHIMRFASRMLRSLPESTPILE